MRLYRKQDRLESIVKKRRLHWFDHVPRMDDFIRAKQTGFILKEEIRGRPHFTWWDTVWTETDGHDREA